MMYNWGTGLNSPLLQARTALELRVAAGRWLCRLSFPQYFPQEALLTLYASLRMGLFGGQHQLSISFGAGFKVVCNASVAVKE